MAKNGCTSASETNPGVPTLYLVFTLFHDFQMITKNQKPFFERAFVQPEGDLQNIGQLGPFWRILRVGALNTCNEVCIVKRLFRVSVITVTETKLQQEGFLRLCVECYLSSSQPVVSLECFTVSQVFYQTFWMKQFGAKTPKRTVVHSNSAHLTKLHLGPMKRASLKSDVKTTKTYYSKDGRKRFCGSEHLKSTQILVWKWIGFFFLFKCEYSSVKCVG